MINNYNFHQPVGTNATTTRPPTTTAISTCGPIPLVLNGVPTKTFPTRLSSVGDTVEFQCSVGFNLTGSTTVVCLANGDWSPLPYCQPG